MSEQVDESLLTPGEEAPPNVRLNKDGTPDKRFAGAPNGRFGPKDKRKRSHRRRTATAPPAPGTFDAKALYDALFNGAMGVATGVLMFSLPGGAAMHPNAVSALESRADAFANSWVAVARQDARVAKYLAALLQGSVWIAAVGNSLAFALLVGVASGRVTTVPLPATFFIPELQTFAAPPTTVRDNGAQAARDSEDGSPGSTLGDFPTPASE